LCPQDPGETDPCLSQERAVGDGKKIRMQDIEPKAGKTRPKASRAKRIARILVGIVLMVLGLAALLTPFTPGSWLALIGLEFLGLRVLLRDRLYMWVAARPQSRFRRIASRVLRMDGFKRRKQ